MVPVNSYRCLFTCCIAAMVFACLPRAAGAADDEEISEIVVTSQRRAQPRLYHAGNIARVGGEEILWTQPQHANELLARVPGAWIVRGSGQDQQMAIRSPVLGGAGSCGGFLILEDGIPTRPAGFCNTNQLIEVNAEQARSVEVIRGPANALFGSNALHGVVNVLMPDPDGRGQPHAGIELGANDYVRARAALPFGPEMPWLVAANYAYDGGFRSASGYRQGKLHAKRIWTKDRDRVAVALTTTKLRQDTAGFIIGRNAYESESLSETNPNPESYRDADSTRLYATWHRAGNRVDLDIRPYLRHSAMEFLHHALPGQPFERNGQVSAGVITAFSVERPNRHTVLGFDLEWSDVYLRQEQLEPASGPPAQQETRPVGKHYDYEVDAIVVAPFIQTEYRLNDAWSVNGGIRFEYARYDYDNRMLSGNTRDDGSVCGFGGCLYSRPADRDDSFSNVAPNLSVQYRMSERSVAFARLARGFRAPQTLELYRLQNGQQLADLDSERVDSLELGLRVDRRRLTADFAVFTMRKRDSVFRDAEGFNVTGARSKHTGVEADMDLTIAQHWLLNANVSFARHEYDFAATGRGESFTKGNDIDTAPRWLGAVEIVYEPSERIRLGLQASGVGSYYLDPANEHEYSGHLLTNLRAAFRPSARYAVMLRVNNLLDTRYADRADFAGRDYRYLPGRGREFFVDLRFLPGG